MHRHKNKIKKYSTGIIFISVLIFLILFNLHPKTKGNKMDWIEGYKLNVPTQELFSLVNLSKEYETDFAKMLSCYMLENDFFRKENRNEKYSIKISDFIINYESIKNKYNNEEAIKYYEVIRKVYSDIKSFPILIEENNKTAEFIYGDSFGAQRFYGGKRLHQGCDIMDRDNLRGRLKIVSMTDGKIEKLGWNEKGGWRVGIRSENGIYYYYAHLKEYSDELYEGKVIKAGEALGLMGDSGYGKEEGTTGKFEVHLHVGIEVENNTWINPYPFLRIIDNRDK